MLYVNKYLWLTEAVEQDLKVVPSDCLHQPDPRTWVKTTVPATGVCAQPTLPEGQSRGEGLGVGHCTLYRIQYTVYSEQYTLYSEQCKVYSVQCTVYSVQYTTWGYLLCPSHMSVGRQ